MFVAMEVYVPTLATARKI